MSHNPNGCYSDCYAARTAKRYGLDFSKSVKRNFRNASHLAGIVRQLKRIDMPFVRIGCSGDPSEDWDHTIGVCLDICEIARAQSEFWPLLWRGFRNQIVIITRHWNILTEAHLRGMSQMNICVNTSVSAMDSPQEIYRSLSQYARLAPFCKSVLRVITCNFNRNNEHGRFMGEVQSELLRNPNVLETVFRPSPDNELVVSGAIIAKRAKFLSGYGLASKRLENIYFGYCQTCPEKCGFGKIGTTT